MEINDTLIQQYNEPLAGGGLPAEHLAELVASEPMVLLHFLRHLGCIYCKHTVEQLRELTQQMPRFPTIYFVHQSPVEVGHDFFAERFPGARHISDPKRKLFQLFGINRLKGFNLLNPKMFMLGIQLMRKGHRNEMGFGDIMMLSGTFLFRDGKLIWKHRAQFAGDDPKWNQLG